MKDKTNEILEDFLNSNDNALLYKKYLENPSVKIKQELDSRFKKHFYLIRCISYFVKMIHFESKHFDKKQRKRTNTFPLLLDKEIEDGRMHTDLVSENKTPDRFESELEDIIESPTLYKAIQKLTDKQKLLLKLIFIHDMKDTEVANELGITQQAVSKSKNNVIKKIRKDIS